MATQVSQIGSSILESDWGLINPFGFLPKFGTFLEAKGLGHSTSNLANTGNEK